MKFSRRILLVVLFLTGSSVCQAQSDRASVFKVIGYYSLRSAMTADVATVPFDKLTHVNLSFLNPNEQGQFTTDLSGLAPFLEAARRHNVKVLASIGGGGKHPYYHDLLTDEKRSAFVGRLVAVADKYGLDGIDVDIEGSDIDKNYEAFVVELAKELKARKKLITSAIAVAYKNQLTDNALAQYDFVNIMSYDHTGPWNPKRHGPHSTFEHATQALEYFGVTRKIPKEKLVLGVPFYGYGFGPEADSTVATMTYRQIVAKFPGAEAADQWTMPDGKIMYYNGLATMRQKTALAKEKASGIMIWQILGDAPAEKSLLTAINETAYGK